MNDYVLWSDFLRVITQSHNALNYGARKSARRVIDHISKSMKVRAEVRVRSYAPYMTRTVIRQPFNEKQKWNPQGVTWFHVNL